MENSPKNAQNARGSEHVFRLDPHRESRSVESENCGEVKRDLVSETTHPQHGVYSPMEVVDRVELEA